MNTFPFIPGDILEYKDKTTSKAEYELVVVGARTCDLKNVKSGKAVSDITHRTIVDVLKLKKREEMVNL